MFYRRWLLSTADAIERLPGVLRPLAGFLVATCVLGPIGLLAWLLVAVSLRLVVSVF